MLTVSLAAASAPLSPVHSAGPVYLCPSPRLALPAWHVQPEDRRCSPSTRSGEGCCHRPRYEEVSRCHCATSRRQRCRHTISCSANVTGFPIIKRGYGAIAPPRHTTVSALNCIISYRPRRASGAIIDIWRNGSSDGWGF